MKIIRFTASDHPEFGVIEPGSEKIAGINGDPLFFKSEPNGKFFEPGEVNVLCPVIPRSKVVACEAGLAGGPGLAGGAGAARLPGGECGRGFPVASLRPNTCVTAPNSVVQLPDYASEGMVRVGVAAVLGKVAKQLNVQDAKAAILGFSLVTCFSLADVSSVSVSSPVALADGALRALQSDAWDTSLPLGPVVFSGDYGDVLESLDGAAWECTVSRPDSEEEPVCLYGRFSWQDGVLGSVDESGRGVAGFDPAADVAALSEVFTLLPGDVVFWPVQGAGAAVGRGVQVFAEVEQLGVQELSVL